MVNFISTNLTSYQTLDMNISHSHNYYFYLYKFIINRVGIISFQYLILDKYLDFNHTFKDCTWFFQVNSSTLLCKLRLFGRMPERPNQIVFILHIILSHHSVHRVTQYESTMFMSYNHKNNVQNPKHMWLRIAFFPFSFFQNCRKEFQ